MEAFLLPTLPCSKSFRIPLPNLADKILEASSWLLLLPAAMFAILWPRCQPQSRWLGKDRQCPPGCVPATDFRLPKLLCLLCREGTCQAHPLPRTSAHTLALGTNIHVQPLGTHFQNPRVLKCQVSRCPGNLPEQ